MSSSTITYTSVSSDTEPWRFEWVSEPEYLEYFAPSDDEAPIEDHPLSADASPIALSPGYVANFDPEEDPEEDPTNYTADGGDGDDDEPSDDDDDDEYKDEKKEHLALADSSAVPSVDMFPQLRIQRHLRLMSDDIK
ncbi:hypothetical protein Tco_0658757 [Tanacetum coccineum]